MLIDTEFSDKKKAVLDDSGTAFFFCVMQTYSNLIPLPALRVIFLDFPSKQTLVFPPLRDWMYKDVTLPSFHSMSTMKPPRAQIPFTLPSFHSSGRAGSRVILFSEDCISISMTPAQPPKLPSIWKGECASSRLG